MTVRNLEFLFHPESIAVVTEPDEPSRYAEVVLRNLAGGGFAGRLMPVTATKRSLFGLGAHLRIDGLEAVPDLAIVCTTLRNAPQTIAELGARGTRAVIVGPSLRYGLAAAEALELRKAILDAAQPHLIRVLGPGSGGLLVPVLGLNASVAPVGAGPGKIALVARSAAIAAAVLDRAYSRGIGFSSVVHLGAGIDIDLADVLDWLAADPHTEAVLVQFEAVTAGRKFMSAARAAARNKPVVAIRGRRVEAAQMTTGPCTTDDVYEAALRRAGWVRIDTLDDLFDAAEALARVRPMRGERLGILASGYGLGRIAADALLHAGGRLATLSRDSRKQLKELLRTSSQPGNPLVLPADSTPANWAAALAAMLADHDTDAVLTVCSPNPFAQGAEVAAALCDVARRSERNVFTCWVGGNSMLEAQQVAAAHGVLSHDSPEKAIAIFLGIVNYERNRQLLIETPPSIAEDFIPDLAAAHGAVAEALEAGAEILSRRQARQLLRAFGVDAVAYPIAGSIEAAIRTADEIGYPVDLGLALANTGEQPPMATGLRSPADIRIAVRGLRSKARTRLPDLRVTGYRLRPGMARSGATALHLGVADDAVFGPVIFLAPASAGSIHGRDFVVALPPLNRTLAEDLVSRSGFAEEAGEEERTALESALSTALVRISQLLTDIDEVAGMEFDPLLVETSGAVALDVRIRVEKRGRRHGFRRFAIRPYPQELERRVDWQGRRLVIRPIRPEDEAALGDLLASLDPEDSRMRFFGAMRSLPRSQLARFTQIDYDREMALVAIEHGSDGVERSLGEVRAMADPDNVTADFAIVVRSELKGRGLGRLLLASIIDYARSRGTHQLHGETLAGNLRMQSLAQSLGFELKAGADRGAVDVRLQLRGSADKAAAAHGSGLLGAGRNDRDAG